MKWTWDPDKDSDNLRKHGIDFETAALVFNNPLTLTYEDDDPNHYEQRWKTIGPLGEAIITIVHTWTNRGTTPMSGRIISARKASRNERREYEEG